MTENQQNTNPTPEKPTPTIGSLLKRIWRRKVRENKSALVLLMVLVGVSIVWFLQQLQNGQLISTTIAPEYTSLPEGYSSGELSRQSIKVSVQMNGFNILSYMVGELPVEVDISKVVEKKDGRHFWVPEKHSDILTAALVEEDVLHAVYTDTIYFNMGDETVKKIPVVLGQTDISPRSGYGVFTDIMFSPTHVNVVGPKNEIDKIDHITIPHVTMRSLDGERNDTIRLVAPEEYRRLHFMPNEIVVTAIAEPYTEETITLNVYPVNAPRGKKLSFIPSKVKVKYHVPLKHYGSISEKDFRVEADMSSYRKSENNVIYLRLKSKPHYVGRVDIVPEKVYFLLK